MGLLEFDVLVSTKSILETLLHVLGEVLKDLLTYFGNVSIDVFGVLSNEFLLGEHPIAANTPDMHELIALDVFFMFELRSRAG